tara:strand:- start:198 stop:1382 length:1185 start_codon:yes stop_codon:yes gene_type:complete
MNKKIKNLIETVLVGEWGNPEGTSGGIDTGVIRSANFAKDHKLNEKKIIIRSIPEKKRQNKLLKKGDILIEKSGGSPTQPVGRVLFYDLSGNHTCSNFISLIRPLSTVDSKFLYYTFCELYNRGGVKGFQQQTTGIINLQLNEYLNEHIFCPSLAEQKKIAEILSGIDALKQHCNDQIKKINLVEKSLWSELFFEEENEEWRKVMVSDIGTVVRGASPRPKGDPRYYGGSIPRLMVADVTRDGKNVIPKIDFLTKEGAKLSRPVPAGTLTIVCSGVVGVPSILSVPACIHDGFLAIKDISKSCLKEYLYYYFKPLQSRLDSSATHGGIFTNLTTEILKSFPVMLPSLGKQKEICEILNTIDSYRYSLLKKKEKIKYLLNGVSAELLSGSKRVNV